MRANVAVRPACVNVTFLPTASRWHVGCWMESAMKINHGKTHHRQTVTLGELVDTVTKMAHNERLGALIVADLINSRKIRLEGRFHNRRVVVG